LTDEYVERKERIYLPKKKQEGGKFKRYVVNPVERVMSPFHSKSDKERRLTA